MATLTAWLAVAGSRRQRRAWVWSLGIAVALAFLLYHGVANIDYNWHWRRAWRYVVAYDAAAGEWVAGALAVGVKTTLQVSAGAAALALGISIAAAAAALSRSHVLRGIVRAYVLLMRCTPLLVQLYLLYFMLGNVLGLERFAAGVFALALFEAAFATEILRSGILSVPQAQLEAARALGLRPLAVWWRIIIPQSLPLILPQMANLFVSLIKHSSIVTIIAIADLTDAARNIISATFLTFEIWLIVGGLYIAICLPLAVVIGKWERQLRRSEQR